MLLKKIKLENIRSYLNQTIDLPSGSVLLSGDIGSGKSTILFALEFALFGIARGALSGESLLRKGKNKGSVEVHLNIEGKEYIIKRTLKKNGDKVVQDSGHIITEGVKKQGTPVELKTQILQLINYPPGVLTRKSLIYRYTVYTPQEAMKKILLDDKEPRLDTLRKVFGIDKYKRIRENSLIYTKNLRNEIKVLNAQLEDLDIKKSELEQKKEEREKLEARKQTLVPQHQEASAKVKKQNEIVSNVEKEYEDQEKVKKEAEITKVKLESVREQFAENNKELSESKKDILALGEEIDKIKILSLETSPESLKTEIKDHESKHLEISSKIKEIEVQKSIIERDKKAILELDECPTCKQAVGSYHKTKFSAHCDSQVKELAKHLEEHKGINKKSKLKLDKLKQDLEKLEKLEQELKINQTKKEHLLKVKKEKEERILKAEELGRKLEQEFEGLDEKEKELDAKISSFGEGLKERIQSEREKLKQIQEDLHWIELQKVAIEKDVENCDLQVKNLEQEIENKLKTKEKIKKFKKYEEWLDKFFINLMSTMEKQVMAQVHSQFNSLFQEWFNLLLDDENALIRLDDEFTPVVTQNGYEINLEDMSGGEKTSIALAYRLALNKVINELMSSIRTKDLLILDEPTDGFSTEQLDRVRLVLDKLNLKQVIIVSHESKIESFVDNCIKIVKGEHVSRVV